MLLLLILASLGATIGGISLSSKNTDNYAHNLGPLFGIHREASISNIQNRPHNLGWLFGVDRKAATESRDENTVCTTDECKLIAKVIKESMNESVDPCDDFYEYACGNWAKNNPLSEDEGELDLWNMLKDKVANQVKEMVQTPIKRDDVLTVKLGKNWYKTCMDRERMNERGLGPLVSTIWSFGGWPLIMEENEWDDETYTWQRVDNYYSQLMAHNNFYRVVVGPLLSDEQIAVLIPPDLPQKTYKLWKSHWDSAEDEEVDEGSQERVSEENNDDKRDDTDSGDDDDDGDNEVDDDKDEDLQTKKVARRKTRMSHRNQQNKKYKVTAKQNGEGKMKKRIKRRATKVKLHARKERKHKKIIKKTVHPSEAKTKEELSKINQIPFPKRVHSHEKEIKLTKTHKLSSDKHIHVTRKKNSVGVDSYDRDNDEIKITNDGKQSMIMMSRKSEERDNDEEEDDEEGDEENDEDDEGNDEDDEENDEDDEENDEDDNGSENGGDSEDDEDDESDEDEDVAEKDNRNGERKLDTEAVEIYSKYILNVALALSEARGVEVSPEKMKEKINDMVQFLIQLNKITQPYDPFFYNTTLAKLQETYDLYEPKTSNAKINWVKKIERLFAASGVEIDENFTITVACHIYIRRLRRLLDETPSETIVNYMHWNFISTMIKATTDEMRDLYSEWDNGKKETEESWSQRCTKEVEMTNTVGYEYVRKYFSEDIEKMATDMIDDIQKEVEYQIKESTWIDEDTKDFILDKLVNLERLIGYPSWYRNDTLVKQHFKGLTLSKSYYDNILYQSRYRGWKDLQQILNDSQDDDEWSDFDPLMLNAFFIPDGNSIAITAVDFQNPLFAQKRPRSINYGIIGLIMAHEVNHGFDNRGHLYDKKGKITEWLSAMAAAYNKRAECFVDQFNRYSLSQSENVTVEDYGNKTAGENIADTMGLQAVFRAYKRRERECDKPDLPLPGLEKFNNDQLFFLSSANLWCENISPEELLLRAKYDSHSTGRLRLIGSFSNSPDFAKAYDCPAGSPMNPVKKCNIWK